MFRAALLPFVFLISLFSCTRNPAIELGKPQYAFNVEATTRLWLIHNLEGEAPWSIQVSRRKDPPPFEPAWIIDSAPQRLSDSLADEKFVHHLLDTLKTVIPRREAGRDQLEAYGLKPARMQVEWTAQEGKLQKTHRIALGNQVSAQEAFARYGTFSDQEGIYEVEGAALRMLELAKDWSMLRYKTLTLWEADDVDRISLADSREYLRAGSDWDRVRDGKTIPAPKVAALLENLMHQRCKRFLDDEKDQDLAEQLSRKSKLQRIQLYTRKGAMQVLEAFSKDGRTFVRNSLRGPIWFEAHPELLETLKGFSSEK